MELPCRLGIVVRAPCCLCVVAIGKECSEGVAVLNQGRKKSTCKLAHARFRHRAVDENLHPTRKQISETDRLASSAVARLRLVRVVLLP